MNLQKKSQVIIAMPIIVVLLVSILFFKPSAVISNTAEARIYLLDYFQEVEQTGAGITFTSTEDGLDADAILQYLSECEKFRIPLLSTLKSAPKNGDLEIVLYTEGKVAHVILGSQKLFSSMMVFLCITSRIPKTYTVNCEKSLNR